MCSVAIATFQQLLAQTVAPNFTTTIDSGDDSKCSVFVVSAVVNASGGRTGCFLYRGKLVTPAPRSRTPSCCPWGRADSCGLLQQDIFGGLTEQEDEVADLAQYEGQELTLYLSYEEASPKMRHRMPAHQQALAPWRAILRDSQDDMIFCTRGLPLQACVDEQLRLAAWSQTVAIAFPTTEDLHAFSKGLAKVDVKRCCLAGAPHGVLLAEYAVQQTLSGGTTCEATSGPAGKTAPAGAPANASTGTSCPQSPLRARLPMLATAGSKRKAEELPAVLMTPPARPRVMSSANLLTPISFAGMPLA